MKTRKQVGKALLYVFLLSMLFGLWLTVHSSPSPSSQVILGKDTRFSPRSDVWVWMGNDLVFTDPPVVDVRFGYANLSNVIWQIVPESGKGVNVSSLESFDASGATTKFLANGTYATYNWTWNPSNPYLKEVEGNLTSLEISAFSSEALTVKVGALTGSNSTLTFSCNGNSRPRRVVVNGVDRADCWSYSQAEDTLTVETTHSSNNEILLDWSSGPGTTGTAKYNLQVKVVDGGGKPLFQSAVTVWRKLGGVVDTEKTDMYGYASFSLAKSSYQVTAEYGTAINSTAVVLDGNKEITIIVTEEKKPILSLAPIREFLGTSVYLALMNYGGWVLLIIGVVLAIIGFSEDMTWLKVVAILLCIGGAVLIGNAVWGSIV